VADRLQKRDRKRFRTMADQCTRTGNGGLTAGQV